MGEVPLLKALATRHEADGLALLGVSVDQTVEAMDRIIAAKGIPWPQIWEPKDADGPIPKSFALDGTPLLYLIDRAGRLAGRFRAVAEVERALPECLAAPASVPRTARDEWQRTNALMDRLGVRGGSVVADVGAGEGYLSLRLAARVGAQGKVFAVDVEKKLLDALRQATTAAGLTQIETVLGAADDPRLPASGLDAVAIVDSYHEFTAPDAMLQRIHAALRPGGRMGMLEVSDTPGRPRAEYGERHRIPPEVLVEEATRHGFRLESLEPRFAERPGDVQYLIVFRKPD